MDGPPDKLVVGVPFYGHMYIVTPNNTNYEPGTPIDRMPKLRQECLTTRQELLAMCDTITNVPTCTVNLHVSIHSSLLYKIDLF